MSSREGEPSQAGWDIFDIVVFMFIFMLGVVVGSTCCLIAQWLYKLVEKLQRIVKNCWGTQKARSKKHVTPCSLFAKQVK